VRIAKMSISKKYYEMNREDIESIQPLSTLRPSKNIYSQEDGDNLKSLCLALYDKVEELNKEIGQLLSSNPYRYHGGI
jgi:hypothetical protein